MSTSSRPDNISERAAGQSLVSLSQGFDTSPIPTKVLTVTKKGSFGGTVVTISKAPIENDAQVLAAYETVESTVPVHFKVGTSSRGLEVIFEPRLFCHEGNIDQSIETTDIGMTEQLSTLDGTMDTGCL